MPPERVPRLDGREVDELWGRVEPWRSGVRAGSQAGAANAWGPRPRPPSLTLFPFLPGRSVPSLAALRATTVSTSTPPQTSLSALKSSGT